MIEEFIEFAKANGITNIDALKRDKAGTPFEVSFDFEVLSKSERTIRGVASVESIDRENELITKSALKEAIGGFEQLPILHYQHTERPIGICTKAQITDRGLEIEGKIPNHPQWDDIWERITKGDLTKYSIHGRRRVFSPECKLAVNSRDSPCITKGLYLDSISIVSGSTAINQDTFVEVVKAMRDELAKSTDNLNIVNDNSSIVMAEEQDITKSEVEQTITSNAVPAVHNADDMTLATKAMPATDVDQMSGRSAADQESLVTSEIVKARAEFESKFDELSKAISVIPELQNKIEELTKANSELTEQNKSLSEKLESVSNEVILKGTQPVVIPEQLDHTSGTFRLRNKF
jgi:hypothetical protein